MCVDCNVSNKITESLLQLIDQQGQEKRSKLKEFIKYFYNFVYKSDLKINNEFLFCIAKDAYDFVLHREKEEDKFVICNVDEIQGIEGKFTIIKIVNNDMPFLVDSVISTIKSHDLTIYYYSNSIINIRRKNDLLDEIFPLESNYGIKESIVYVVIKSISHSFIDTLKESLLRTLKAVSYSVKDWHLMLKKLNDAGDTFVPVETYLEENRHVNGTYHTDQVKNFFYWLRDNFVFLGYQECIPNDNGKLTPNKKENLGLLRLDEEYNNVMISSEDLSCLYILRSHLVSIVHRCTYLTCIGVKEFNEHKELIKERRFFGLFTSKAEVQDIQTISVIKDIVKAIERRAGFVAGGHNNKALIYILQTFTCAELLQSSENELFQICTAVMSLAIRPRIRLFLKVMGIFVSCVVLIPMRYANAKLMLKIRDILKSEIGAESSDIYNRNIIDEYDLMKLHVVLKINNLEVCENLNNEISRIESKLRKITEKWEDRFIDNLYNTFGTVEDIFIRYCNAFPVSYQESFEPNEAYHDIKKMEILRKNGICEVDLRFTADNLNYQLKVYTQSNGGLELSRILKVTENLGAKVLSHNSYYIEINGGIWIHNFTLFKSNKLVNNITLKEQF